MCFDNDGDWCATINESTDGPSEKDCHCSECRCKISAGEFCRHIFQQESEECSECGLYPLGEGEVDELEDDELPRCEGDCEYGETWSGDICESCLKIRQAIHAYELKEGCPEFAAEPLYGGLDEVFQEHEQRWEYADACVSMFPELIDSKFVGSLLED